MFPQLLQKPGNVDHVGGGVRLEDDDVVKACGDVGEAFDKMCGRKNVIQTRQTARVLMLPPLSASTSTLTYAM